MLDEKFWEKYSKVYDIKKFTGGRPLFFIQKRGIIERRN